MCGIYGTTVRYASDVVKRKLDTINFRGPDYQGITKIERPNGQYITLGHNRLAIMDLDARSNQPFKYNENITVVFNGEVYNFLELKAQYCPDVQFRTDSDTEVICAMYEKFGIDCISKMNGMFAFVIYDKSKDILVGGRDRLGKKPFYYMHTAQGFEFASQPSCISIGNEFHIDDTARSYMMLLGYIPDPYSIWKEVKKLRAGECFIYNLQDNKLQISQYWDLFTNSCGFRIPKTYDEAKEQTRELLEDAVKLRLNADVPVGMFLSGGIDSSLTSALVAKCNKNITAYTIGFNDSKYNESAHATDVAKSLDVPFEIIKCEGADMLGIFKDFYKYYDEPFADNSLIPTSLLAQKARQDVTVAIGGDGGDELFMGYWQYRSVQRIQKMYRACPYFIRHSMYKLLSPVVDVERLDLCEYPSAKERFYAQGSFGKFRKARRFDNLMLAHTLPDVKYLDDSRGWRQYSDYDMKQVMNSCINTKTDRATMRSSLELRSPIMDYRLAEYSRLLPYEYLYSSQLGGGKRILRDILYEMVPREILDRPKQGFGAPVRQWFRNELRDEFMDIVSLPHIAELIPELDANKLVFYRDNFLKGNGPTLHEQAFFKVYSYILWYLHKEK